MKFTKSEVVGVVFSKLAPKLDDTFADVGCGTGQVSEFFAPYVRKVYAIDEDEKAISLAREKLSNFKNVELIRMNGVEFLRRYKIDLAFFGGTKNIEEMLDICSAKRFVVNAARIEVAERVMRKMKELGVFKELVIVNISKSYELAGGTAFKSLNPVFMVVGCSTE
ncbi:MAG: methyltransferase domain-containing protein [Archaeoglobaceae archaeon]